MVIFNVWLLPAIHMLFCTPVNTAAKEWDRQHPTVLVVLLVRNKAHTLPFFLGHLEDLDYPKNRIALFIRTDHNVDQSKLLLDQWINNVGEFYHKIDYKFNMHEIEYMDSSYRPFHWSDDRLRNVVRMKQDALDAARQFWADYVFFIDCDVFLTNRRVLQSLMSSGKPVVAPFLRGPTNDDYDYSNFEIAQGEDSFEFKFLFDREQPGVYLVSEARNTLLIDLNNVHCDLINFIDPTVSSSSNDSQSLSDVTVLSKALSDVGLQYHLDNRRIHGWFTPPMHDSVQNLTLDAENLHFLALELITEHPPGLLYSPFVQSVMRQPSYLGLDNIFLINLERRQDRLDRMTACFNLLDVNFTLTKAVDGSILTDDALQSLHLRLLPGFIDPYKKRPMTKGEIGCFLSHYNIWQSVLDNKYEMVAVFEDDLRFVRYFRTMLTNVIDELKSRANFDWDLIYLGRKRLYNESDAKPVAGSRYLRTVGYTYWTLGYLLSLNGAKKLLSAKPLQKLVPVDEYLPIMYDRHPETKYSRHFEPRDLIAYTVDPLFVHPVRYTGQDGYVSDTESSDIFRIKAAENADTDSEGFFDATSVHSKISDEL